MSALGSCVKAGTWRNYEATLNHRLFAFDFGAFEAALDFLTFIANVVFEYHLD